MSLLKTTLYEKHKAAGATFVPFAEWKMPVQYKTGIIKEHLSTRKTAGIFDVSHMGRFAISGTDALPFLQHVLSNNAAALKVFESQYTIIPNETGGAVDDAYLYRFSADNFLLVVNASNREKVWAHFQAFLHRFPKTILRDDTFKLSMLSLQGPTTRALLTSQIDAGRLPDPIRNQLSIVTMADTEVKISRTGYTGEPIGYELFFPSSASLNIWEKLVTAGAVPVGLGARDTLRLEAGLPLYGHELGTDRHGDQIPIYSLPLARFAVSRSPAKGDFVGRKALTKQFAALKKIINRDYSLIHDLPRMIMPMEITGKGLAREGDAVFAGDVPAGYITSGTMVPYWLFDRQDIRGKPSENHANRAIALGLIRSDIVKSDALTVSVRGKKIAARLVPYHLRSDAPPFARAVI